MLCFPILNALVVARKGVFLDTGYLFDNRFGNFKLALALVGIVALVFSGDVTFILAMLIVHNRRFAFHVFGSPGLLLFEIVFLVDVFNYLLVARLDVFYLLLQVFELLVQHFYLLNSSVTASFADRLRNT